MRASPRTEATIQLQDGRRLGYAERGAPTGTPVLMFHGSPGSRLEHHAPPETYDRLGIRYIGVDRPGMGLSDPLPGRTVLDWAGDVIQLADALALDRFSILGYSGGAPYAAACAHQIPEAIAAVGIVSGSASNPRPGLHEVSPHDERYADTSWAERFRSDPVAFLSGIFASDASIPASDREQWERSEVQEWLGTSISESFAQGIGGAVYDNFLDDQRWGFDPAEIRVPVFLWHGEADVNASPAHARSLAASIPGCRSTFYPGEGHLMIFKREADFLRALTR